MFPHPPTYPKIKRFSSALTHCVSSLSQHSEGIAKKTLGTSESLKLRDAVAIFAPPRPQPLDPRQPLSLFEDDSVNCFWRKAKETNSVAPCRSRFPPRVASATPLPPLPLFSSLMCQAPPILSHPGVAGISEAGEEERGGGVSWLKGNTAFSSSNFQRSFIIFFLIK